MKFNDLLDGRWTAPLHGKLHIVSKSFRHQAYETQQQSEKQQQFPAVSLRTVCLNLFPAWTRIVLEIAARVFRENELQSRRIPSLSGV
jgi:hypothetical protein